MDVDDYNDAIALIASSSTLPNGRVYKNRLVKAAMEEGIGRGNVPDERHRRLYARWAEGDWGMIITGNVQVDATQRATAHDLCVPRTHEAMLAYRQLRETVRAAAPETLALAQVSHAGIQSSSTAALCRGPWVPALGPVTARPDIGPGAWAWMFSRALWPTKSRVLRGDDWLGIVELFVDAAKKMEECGWDGVQVHAAHGYLLAEYLSPLTNPDPEPLPGCPYDVPLRLQLLYLILTGIHDATDRKFIKAVKVNCSDFADGGVDEAQAAETIKTIVSWNLVDMLEVSGGTYINPAFAVLPTSTRQSLFAHFTTSLIPHLPTSPDGPAILLTGGLHTRELIATSLRNRACDVVGIGRPSCVYPTLPRDVMLNPVVEDAAAVIGGYEIPRGDRAEWLISGLKGKGKIKLISAGVGTWWHENQMARIGRGVDPDPQMGFWAGIWMEWVWFGMLAWLGRCLRGLFVRTRREVTEPGGADDAADSGEEK
ncbi:hypothetical protein Q5752_001347 [Cryptotrichosporon argae]